MKKYFIITQNDGEYFVYSLMAESEEQADKKAREILYKELDWDDDWNSIAVYAETDVEVLD